LGVWYEQPKEIRDSLKSFRRSLFAPIAHKLGWQVSENDDYLTSILRVLAITNAGRSNDEATVEEAKKRFWEFVGGNSEAIHPNLRGPVFNIVLGAAEDEQEEHKLWEEVLKIYRDESLPSDQRLVALNCLGGIKSETLIKRYLEMSLDEKEIRGQDSFYVYSSLSANPDARDLFWQFFTEHFGKLHDKFSKSLSLFGAAVKCAVGGFVSLDRIKEAEEFFADKDTKEYARSLEQALEGARVNAHWVNRDHTLVADWLRDNAHKFA
jgi:aminopeptidase 2